MLTIENFYSFYFLCISAKLKGLKNLSIALVEKGINSNCLSLFLHLCNICF